METMELSKLSKTLNQFECLQCEYVCFRKSDWKKHLTTQKHNGSKGGTKMELLGNLKMEENDFSCDCGKIFKTKSGLWKHRKNCDLQVKNELIQEPSVGLLLVELLKQNEEFKKIMLEQNTKMLELVNNQPTTNTTINNNNNNTMNNKFNLNFFLNETCKDAMNIQEFIDFCKVQHTDFENFGKYGYVESMTRIIMRNLMELEVHRRPIHCTDAKREVLYVKDNNNVWVNDFSREKLIRAIKYIAAKNVKQIPDWMDHNPDSKNTQTKLHDKYMRMVCHSMGGRDEAEDQEYYKKIIHNVAKEVVINKNI